MVKANNDVADGIRVTADLLKQRRIVLCDTCTDCLREMELYCWDPAKGRDAPRKEHDHAMDDMRYFAHGCGRRWHRGLCRRGCGAADVREKYTPDGGRGKSEMLGFQKKQPSPRPAFVQLRDSEHHPFGLLRDYVPLHSGEVRLYRAVREAVPVVDAAIYKLIRMTGGVQAECSDETAQRQLQEFLRTVPAGRGPVRHQRVFGHVPGCTPHLRPRHRRDRAAPGRPGTSGHCCAAGWTTSRSGRASIRWRSPSAGPMKQGRMVPLPYQDLLLFTPLNPEAENPYGVSLLRSLPFLSDVLMKIYHTIGVNWERCGNVRFAVTCRDGDNRGMAQERSRQLAGEWSRAMQETKGGSVRDLLLWGMWRSKSSAATHPFWTVKCRCGRSWSRLWPRPGSRPSCWD